MDLDIVKLDLGLENKSDKIQQSANWSAVYADRLDNSVTAIQTSLGEKTVSGAVVLMKNKNKLGILRSFIVHYSCSGKYMADAMLI